jgi:hypothetical protein
MAEFQAGNLAKRRPLTRRDTPVKLELLTMQEGLFLLGEGPFCYSVA